MGNRSRFAVLLCLAVLVLSSAACVRTNPSDAKAANMLIAVKEASETVYTDKSPEEVLAAARQVLELADGEDFTFRQRRDGFIGKREFVTYWVVNAGVGADYWLVRAVPEGNGSRVTVRLVEEESYVVGPKHGEAPTDLTVAAEQGIQSEALYRMFFARMNYLLGLSTEWVGCKQEKDFIDANGYLGDCDHLCGFFSFEDKQPGS